MNANTDLFYFINNSLANPVFDAVMPYLTNLGGFATLVCLSLIAILVCRHYKKERYLRIAKLCLMALLLSGAVVAALKLCFHEPRPYTVLGHARQLVVPSEPNSFPSGHTSSAFSVVTVLASELQEHKKTVTALIALCILIAFSRIYCGMHYPLDIAAGAAAGMASAAVVLKVKV